MSQTRNKPPNFIIILTDDQGYGDLSCFGGEHVYTPNVDNMAKEGSRLTNFYVSSSICTPSRAALMTGCYPKRIGMASRVLLASDSIGLHPDEVTIAEILNSAGYRTGIFGKWHLGDQPQFLPTQQGFDTYFGLPYSHDIHPYHQNQEKYNFPSLPLMVGDVVSELDPEADFLLQRFTEKAVDFIETHQSSPFFLYLAHTSPHRPLLASPEFMKEASSEILEALKLEEGKVDYETRDKIYPQTIKEVDWSVGEILKALKAHDLEDNTLVIFTSDNGPKIGSSGSLRGGKGSTLEGGFRMPTVVRWPGKIPANTTNHELITAMDLFPTFAKCSGAQLSQDHMIDGKDVLEVLRGKLPSPHDAFLYYNKDRLEAVRSGKWKLFITGSHAPALYDLEEDIGETKNVLGENPIIEKKLRSIALQIDKEISDNKRPAGIAKNPKPLTIN